MKHVPLKILCVIGLIAVTNVAMALQPIPTEDGFTGYFNIGAGGINAKSNMISGNQFGDVGHKTITSLTDPPGSKNDTLPIFNGEIAYTFTDIRTQLYAGNTLEDFLEFDFTALVGIRHELADKGLIAASYIFASIPAEVWKDPYLINQSRSKADRDIAGVQLEWDRIAGSKFGLKYTYRDIDIDDELSGNSLDMSTNDQALLSREGKIHDVEIAYRFNINNRHFIKPTINYIDRDLDGGAMKGDAWVLGVRHLYNLEKYSVVTLLKYANSDFDKRNPIYNKTRDDKRWGGSVTTAYKQPFGLKDWNALATVAYYDSNSNIDFYDTTMTFFGLSALYKF